MQSKLNRPSFVRKLQATIFILDVQLVPGKKNRL